MTPPEAYRKARKLEKRIPELEPVISQDAFYSYLYAKNIIKGKWGKAEPAISKDACYSYLYAREVIKGKLPDFMHNQMILEKNEYTKEYVKFIQ